MTLFSDLTQREMMIVEGFLHERTYLKDEVIFDEGDDSQAIYFVRAGSVLICPQGRADQAYTVLGKGDTFGELALLDDAPRVTQARAAEGCTVLALFRGDFSALMTSHALIASKIALQLARHLGRILRSAARRQAVVP